MTHSLSVPLRAFDATRQRHSEVSRGSRSERKVNAPKYVLSQSVGACNVALRKKYPDKSRRGVYGDEVIGPERTPSALKGVLRQCLRLRRVAFTEEYLDYGDRSIRGDGMIGTENALSALQRVLSERASLRKFTVLGKQASQAGS